MEKTTWDWVLVNDAKPIWLRSPKEIEDNEYDSFYRLFSKDSTEPLAKIHFTAEGEVTFKAILFVPAVSIVCVWGGGDPATHNKQLERYNSYI